MKVGYIRVSTVEQNDARQKEALKHFGIEKYFCEKVSAKSMDRPELLKALEFCREGDTLHVHDFSRLARSTQDLLQIVETLTHKGVHLVSTKENVDTSSPTGRLMLTLIAAIAQFERENLLERQREGIAIAKAEGKYKGRKPINIEGFEPYYNSYMNREFNKTQLAKKLRISRPTLDKLIQEFEQNHATTEQTHTV